ncbi:GTP-binding protein YsxC [Petrotoga mexicana DSM 14811]|uniref:Probable GTP-binding protein EngB n=1 Tax=Petrotoga mexicana DSM 14811 TaxID=1122954 RepID=A0A2K1P942_9BACT|nr:ribosome biogenesis GTP-binding protein YihA/YsxC [Petrotoga mexicana]PNR99312.1 GTP-binding protein YsxC [Petrotoga mexicana DSM 14811]
MKVYKAQLIKTVYNIEDLPPPDKKEIAFAGRSNVGKSSFLNAILGIKIAKVSSTPGKTRSINYYLVNDKYYFVDLPGYGFASVSKQEKERWNILMNEYFKNRFSLNAVSLLIDHRHMPQKLDYAMVEWLKDLGTPFLFILTKSDKLKKSEKAKLFEDIKSSFLTYGEYIYLPFSSKTKEGLKEVLKTIGEILGEVD